MNLGYLHAKQACGLLSYLSAPPLSIGMADHTSNAAGITFSTRGGAQDQILGLKTARQASTTEPHLCTHTKLLFCFVFILKTALLKHFLFLTPPLIFFHEMKQ